MCARQRFASYHYAAILGLLLWCWSSLSIAASYDQGLLWRIEPNRSGGAAASYIFGTIHSEDPRVLALPNRVTTALHSSRQFAMEMIPDLQAMQRMQQAMFFGDGTQLKELLGAPMYSSLQRAIAPYGIPAVLLATMKPWAAMLTLSMPRPRTGIFLDMQLYMEAVSKGMEVRGLESAAEQIAVFEQLTLAEQKQLLAETLRQLPQQEALFSSLHSAYLAQDLAAMERLNRATISATTAAISERLLTGLLDDRNRRMVERLQPLINHGGLFTAIGALHLYGSKGVLALLARHGYGVRRVE